MQPYSSWPGHPLLAQRNREQPWPQSAPLRFGYQSEVFKLDLRKRTTVELAKSKRFFSSISQHINMKSPALEQGSELRLRHQKPLVPAQRSSDAPIQRQVLQNARALASYPFCAGSRRTRGRCLAKLHVGDFQRRVVHSPWNTRVRNSMLSRGGAPAGAVGSTNAACGTKRARPSSAESKHLISMTSCRPMEGA